ncbi:hypothetical protein P4S73_15715 [Paraglaciecola sp. Hal342]
MAGLANQSSLVRNNGQCAGQYDKAQHNSQLHSKPTVNAKPIRSIQFALSTFSANAFIPNALKVVF